MPEKGCKEHRVLNLGAGVQSTTVYLMYVRGEITPQIEYAIFADTGEEPASIYRHLEWLKSLSGPPIVSVSIGKLGDDLQQGRSSPASDSRRFPRSRRRARATRPGLFAANARVSTRSIRLNATSAANSWEWRADSGYRLAQWCTSRTASRWMKLAAPSGFASGWPSAIG